MKESSVYITRRIPDKAINYLKEQCRVEVNPEKRAHTRAELLERVRGRDAVLSTMQDTIDAEVMDAAGKQCRIFANFAVGYNM